MKSLILAVILAAAAATVANAATPVPCEDMLTQVKTAMKGTNLSDADKAKVVDLQDKGIERCKADDDAHADEFFTAALKVMGK